MANNQKKKILIVDDELETIKTTAEILSQNGFEVLMASDGSQGLTMANEEPPDLVLLDIKLPDFNGFEFLKEVRERKIETRIALMSAYLNKDEDIVKGIRAGACDFISKPLEPIKVLNRVKKAIALDTTLNTQVIDSAPIIKEFVANAERLKAENRIFKFKAYSSEKKTMWTRLMIRLLSVVSAILIVIILFEFNIVKDSIVIVGTIVLLTILLITPIDRAYEFTAKIVGFQTEVKMTKEQPNEESIKRNWVISELTHEYFKFTHTVEHWLRRLESNPSDSATTIDTLQAAVSRSREHVESILKSKE
jgi:DNA-binding response OmpR family regulator